MSISWLFGSTGQDEDLLLYCLLIKQVHKHYSGTPHGLLCHCFLALLPCCLLCCCCVLLQDPRDDVSGEHQVAEDMLDFLQEFFEGERGQGGLLLLLLIALHNQDLGV
jgi:hypothetical protein